MLLSLKKIYLILNNLLSNIDFDLLQLTSFLYLESQSL